MITNAYEDCLDFSTQRYFKSFLELLGKQKEHGKLLTSYAQALFGDQTLKGLSDLRKLLDESPIAFFFLASHYFADPPSMLSSTDRIRVAENLVVPVQTGFEYLTMTDSGLWLRNLSVSKNDQDAEEVLVLSWYAPQSPDIVPLSIYQFMKSAALCFRSDLFQGTLTLAAIAFEACLRQAIIEHGIHILQVGRKYPPIKAQIDAYNDDPQVRLGITLKGATERLEDYFEHKANHAGKDWLGNFVFRIAREDLLTDDGEQVKLWVDVPQEKRSYLCSDKVTTPGNKHADRFKEFTAIAEQHGWFREAIIPGDSAEVIRLVRNKLVHWDDSSLDDTDIDGMTLREHINDRNRVLGTLKDLALFISEIYEGLAALTK
jgi:hypothetical protein